MLEHIVFIVKQYFHDLNNSELNLCRFVLLTQALHRAVVLNRGAASYHFYLPFNLFWRLGVPPNI